MDSPSQFIVVLLICTAILWAFVMIVARRTRIRVSPELIIGTMIWSMGLSTLAPSLIPRSVLVLLSPGDLPTVFPSTYKDVSHVINGLFLLTLLLGLLYVYGHHMTRREYKPIYVIGVLISVMFALSAIFGTVPSISWKILIWPLTLTLAYLIPHIPLKWLVKQLRNQYLIVVVASLISAVLFPHWAFSAGTVSTPSPSMHLILDRVLRLQGLTDHPNQLGESALLAYITTYWLKDARLRRTMLTLCLVALLLSGSRTTILALPIALFFLWIHNKWQNRKIRSVLVALFSGLSAFAVFSILQDGFLSSSNSGFLNGLGTLNGRTQIWSITLQQWRQSPLVGYGPTLWSAAFRLNHGLINLNWADAAHNEFLQVLGGGGLLELGALISFLLLLLAKAWRHRRFDNGLALSFIAAIIIIMMTEVPFDLTGLPVSLYGLFPIILIIMNVSPTTIRGRPFRHENGTTSYALVTRRLVAD
jgi:O-antigen ligase